MKNTIFKKALILLFLIGLNQSGIIAQKNINNLVTIINEKLIVNVKPLGAELQNIISNKSQKEYLWQGNSEYWGQRSPILFPVVGRLWKNGYNLDGKRYQMETHGFAKDCTFDLILKKETEAWFKLTDTDETFNKYPFHFELIVGYVLDGKSLKVIWKVKNKSEKDMFFQIGGHPGFAYPDFEATNKSNGFLKFESMNTPLSYIVKEKNNYILPTPQTHYLNLDKEGLLPITLELFKHHALIFENYQARKIIILDRSKNPFLSLEFDMPVFALWSPSKKNAPFISIEPWWGIGDKIDYSGELGQKNWMQKLSPDESFVTSYTVNILE